MNTTDLIEMICQYCHNFGGVFAANELDKLRNNAFYVLNTDPLGAKGKHWIVMNVNNNLCEFFDSAGNHPSYYHKSWHNFLLKKSGAYVYNDLPFQKENTQVCGDYCILYVILRNNKVPFASLIRYLEHVNMDESINTQLKSMICYSSNPEKTIETFISRMHYVFESMA